MLLPGSACERRLLRAEFLDEPTLPAVPQRGLGEEVPVDDNKELVHNQPTELALGPLSLRADPAYYPHNPPIIAGDHACIHDGARLFWVHPLPDDRVDLSRGYHADDVLIERREEVLRVEWTAAVRPRRHEIYS